MTSVIVRFLASSLPRFESDEEYDIDKYDHAAHHFEHSRFQASPNEPEVNVIAQIYDPGKEVVNKVSEDLALFRRVAALFKSSDEQREAQRDP